MRKVGVAAALLALAAAEAQGALDSKCQAGCLSQGYVQDFCTRTCTDDAERKTIPAFGGPAGTHPPAQEAAAPTPEKKPEPETKPRPPTATLEAFNPARDALRDELRRLSLENAALKKELAAARKALVDLQRKAP